jgi:hypothetical protein
MNDDQLSNLFTAARRALPDTARAELAFETRLLARLRAQRQTAPWFVWTWRLAPLFAAIVIALGAWNITGTSDPLADLNTGAGDEAALVVMLTGE